MKKAEAGPAQPARVLDPVSGAAHLEVEPVPTPGSGLPSPSSFHAGGATMKISRILGEKGHDVHTISPDRTVLEAMNVLVERDIGSLVVVEGDGLRGIITERDVLRLGADGPERLSSVTVEEAMTSELVTCAPGDDVDAVMETMTRRRIRHLPVVEEGELRGLVSIGDAVKATLERVAEENRHLKEYIHGGR